MPPLDSAQQEAFLRNWMQAQPAVAAYALSRLGDPHAVDDVVQEVALAAQRSYGDYDQRRSFVRWILGIAHHKIVDHLRARRTTEPLESSEAERSLREASIRLAGELSERASAMQDCVARLRPERRELLRRFYLDQESVREIAERMRMGLSAVKVTLHRLRRSLRECVRRRLAEENLR